MAKQSVTPRTLRTKTAASPTLRDVFMTSYRAGLHAASVGVLEILDQPGSAAKNLAMLRMYLGYNVEGMAAAAAMHKQIVRKSDRNRAVSTA
jgi:hypothetical protein